MTSPTVTIQGEQKITSWEDDYAFTMWVEPRMATAKEINDAFAKIAKSNDGIIGKFNELTFIK